METQMRYFRTDDFGSTDQRAHQLIGSSACASGFVSTSAASFSLASQIADATLIMVTATEQPQHSAPIIPFPVPTPRERDWREGASA